MVGISRRPFFFRWLLSKTLHRDTSASAIDGITGKSSNSSFPVRRRTAESPKSVPFSSTNMAPFASPPEITRKNVCPFSLKTATPVGD
jgi:hypothetical protein